MIPTASGSRTGYKLPFCKASIFANLEEWIDVSLPQQSLHIYHYLTANCLAAIALAKANNREVGWTDFHANWQGNVSRGSFFGLQPHFYEGNFDLVAGFGGFDKVVA